MDKRSGAGRQSLKPQVNTITFDFDPRSNALNGNVNRNSSDNMPQGYAVKGRHLKSSGGMGGNGGFTSVNAGGNNYAYLSGAQPTSSTTSLLFDNSVDDENFPISGVGYTGAPSSSSANLHARGRTASQSQFVADFPSDNSVARFNGMLDDGGSVASVTRGRLNQGSMIGSSSSSILSVSRIGPEQRVRASEEMAKVRQRAIVTEEEKKRLVEGAMSLDAPKIARQVIREKQEQQEKQRSVSNGRNSKQPTSFMTFESTTNNVSNNINGHSTTNNKLSTFNEDQEFLKVHEEVERQRKRMISRANMASAGGGGGVAPPLTHQQSKKFVMRDPQVSQEILNSIAGLIDDINLSGGGEAESTSKEKEDKEALMRLAHDISSVRDSYPTGPPLNTTTTVTSARSGSFSPVFEDYHKSNNNHDSPAVPAVHPAPATTPKTPRTTSTRFKATISDSAAGVVTPRRPVEEKETDETEGEGMNSSFRRNRNHHLKVLLLSTLRDWLALECQVPIGGHSQQTEIEQPCPSTPGGGGGLTNINSTTNLESPGFKFLLGLDSNAPEPSSPSTSRFKLDNISSPSSRGRLGSKGRDISKSTASLHALLTSHDGVGGGGLGLDVPLLNLNGERDHEAKTSSSVAEPSSLLRQPSSNFHNNNNAQQKLRFSAKQNETPLFYLSQALRMLESTLLKIDDYHSHHLPAINGAFNPSTGAPTTLPTTTNPHANAKLSENASDQQFRSHFRKSLWATALAGSAAGNFVADIISERNLGSN